MMREQGAAKVAPLVFITLLCTLLSAALVYLRAAESFENRTWDLRVRLGAAGHRPDPNIKIIIIDQGSLDYFDKEEEIRWPFPRSLYIPVIRFLERAGAKALAFDMLFTEPSVHGVSDDADFAASVGGRLPIASALSLSTTERSGDEERFRIFKERSYPRTSADEITRQLGSERFPPFKSATFPISELLRNSAAIGSVNSEPDPDGVFRHYVPGGTLGGRQVLGLPFALYSLVEKSPKLDLDQFFDEEGRLPVRLYGPSGTYQTESVARVISSYVSMEKGEKPQVDPQFFKDAFVFLGVWSPGLGDLRPTALDEKSYGVEFNAAVFDNLLNRGFVRHLPRWQGVMLGLVFTLVAVLIVSRARSIYSQILVGPLVFAAFIAIHALLAYNNIWADLVGPGVGMIAALLSVLSYEYITEGRQRRFIKDAFAHYVSPQVIEAIIKNPQNLSLGGEKKELTIFFSDLAGFTTLSEKLDPTKLVQLLNKFLSAMTDIIIRSGGTVDKYVGDAIVAFWNAPVDVPEHRLRGVEAALECQRQLERLNPEFEREFGVKLVMRTGLHSGSVAVGNFGSKDRFNYTMVGDSANFASRLEGTNKVFGTRTLISESTQQGVEGKIRCRRVGAIQVVGKSEAISIYEPLGPGLSPESEVILGKYEAALKVFESGKIAEALTLFREIPDPVAQAYVKRLESEEAAAFSGGASATWVLDSK